MQQPIRVLYFRVAQFAYYVIGTDLPFQLGQILPYFIEYSGHFFAKKIVMKNHHLLLLTELRRYLRRDLEINWVIWFFKWAIPGLSFVYFRSFSEKPPYNFCSKLMWKNVHPVYGAGIWTHDPQITSLVPWPLDHGSRPAELYGLLRERLILDKIR